MALARRTLTEQIIDARYVLQALADDQDNLYVAIVVGLGLPKENSLILRNMTWAYALENLSFVSNFINDPATFLLFIAIYNSRAHYSELKILSEALSVNFKIIYPHDNEHTIQPMSAAGKQTVYLRYDGQRFSAYAPLILPPAPALPPPPMATTATGSTVIPKFATAFSPRIAPAPAKFLPPPTAINYQQHQLMSRYFDDYTVKDNSLLEVSVPSLFTHGLTLNSEYLNKILALGAEGYKNRIPPTPKERFQWVIAIASSLLQTDCLDELRKYNRPATADIASPLKNALYIYHSNIDAIVNREKAEAIIPINCEIFLMLRLIHMLEIYFSLDTLEIEQLNSLEPNYASPEGDKRLRLKQNFIGEIVRTLLAYRIEFYHEWILNLSEESIEFEVIRENAIKHLSLAIISTLQNLPKNESLILPLTGWSEHRIYIQVIHFLEDYYFFVHNYGEGSGPNTHKINAHFVHRFSESNLPSQGFEYLARILALKANGTKRLNKDYIYKFSNTNIAASAGAGYISALSAADNIINIHLIPFPPQPGDNCVAYGFNCANDSCMLNSNDLELREGILTAELSLLAPRLGVDWTEVNNKSNILDTLMWFEKMLFIESSLSTNEKATSTSTEFKLRP